MPASALGEHLGEHVMQTRCGGRVPDQRPHAVDGPTDLAHGLAEQALVGFLPLADLLARPVLVVRRLSAHTALGRSHPEPTPTKPAGTSRIIPCRRTALASAGARVRSTGGLKSPALVVQNEGYKEFTPIAFHMNCLASMD